MTGQADRMEALIKNRIEQNRHERSDVPRLAGARFRPLQLAGTAAAVGRDYQRQRWSVGELLAYYDRQFVQNAYLVLLKRDADVEGLERAAAAAAQRPDIAPGAAVQAALRRRGQAARHGGQGAAARLRHRTAVRAAAARE